MRRLVALLAGMMLLTGMATAANALSLQYSTDGIHYTTVADNGPEDGFGSLGHMGLNFSAGTFNSITVTADRLNIPSMGSLFTNSYQVSSTAPGTLYLKVSDLAYNLLMPSGSGANSLTKLTIQDNNAIVDLETFYGTTLFDMANLIADIDVTVPSMGVSSATAALPTITSPFSLTEYIVITHNGPSTSQITGSLQLTPVPEPGTMMLLGIGFLGLAIYGKRRRNA